VLFQIFQSPRPNSKLAHSLSPRLNQDLCVAVNLKRFNQWTSILEAPQNAAAHQYKKLSSFIGYIGRQENKI
jgi:hypothetical protein